ncbi:acyl-CoA carboxylase subunit epsilon [Streptomyces sp. NPDC057616]|uniref:acyl-CoA carboxylase subunit epsilon n=1 Tax=Streptomyces sp. NPDC057616 TaxID=3346183 RepID=UPI003699A53F
MSASSDTFLHIAKGQAEPEELAAITAVLLARAAAQRRTVPAHHGRSKAGWRRLERTPGFRSPRSWQD